MVSSAHFVILNKTYGPNTSATFPSSMSVKCSFDKQSYVSMLMKTAAILKTLSVIGVGMSTSGGRRVREQILQTL